MNKDSDLSEYERVRLENIRRNNEFLAQLGLAPLQPKVIKVEVPQTAPRKAVAKVKREETANTLTQDKRRRSGRLSGEFVKEELLNELKEDPVPLEHVETESFYERIPQVPYVLHHHNPS